MKSLVIFIVMTLVSVSAFAQNVHVDGYYKKDGTYVSPHWRSSPDGDTSNNWSSEGNYNPYTGKEGHRKYDSGYNSYGSLDNYGEQKD